MLLPILVRTTLGSFYKATFCKNADKITLADNKSTHEVIGALEEVVQKIPASGVSSGGLDELKEKVNGHDNNQGKYIEGQDEEKDEVIPQELMIQDTLKYSLPERP